MLSPFKIIGPFAMVERRRPGIDSPHRALGNALLHHCAADRGFPRLGEGIMSSFAIPLPVLSLAAGPILFLVAQSTSFQQFRPHHAPRTTATRI